MKEKAMKAGNPITTMLEWQGITVSVSCQRGYAGMEGLPHLSIHVPEPGTSQLADHRDRLSLALPERGRGRRVRRAARLRPRTARCGRFWIALLPFPRCGTAYMRQRPDVWRQIRL